MMPHGHRSGVFTHCHIDLVEQRLMEWALDVGRFASSRRYRMPLAQAWQLVEERTVPTERGILIPFGRDWTAFFDNHKQEHIDSSIPSNFTRLLHVPTFAFDHDPESGAVFRAFVPGYESMNRRFVMVSKEGSWKFVEDGEPLPFEQLEAYQRKNKRDRLTEDMLRAYGEAIGIPFWDDTQYGTDVVLLERKGAKPKDPNLLMKTLQGIASSLGGKLTRLTPEKRDE